MARDHARVNLSIWNDDDFRDLPGAAQHLYFLLWTHPELNYAGIVDWRPGRIAARVSDWTSETVQTVADCLEHRLFIVRDHESEECLVRSWVRFDGITKSPQMAVSFANAFAAASSSDIRGVIVHEAIKLRELEPENAGWSKRQVQDLLTKRSLDPRTRDIPADPLAPGLAPHLAPPLAPSGGVGVSTPGSTPPTPAPAPAPFLQDLPDADASDDDAEKRPSRRKPERPLPNSWKPTAKHHEFANEHGIDIPQQEQAFKNHAETHDRRARDWDAAFRTWLNKSAEKGIGKKNTSHADNLYDRLPRAPRRQP